MMLQPRRQQSLAEPAEDAAHADVDLEHPEFVVGVDGPQLEGDVVDPDHLASLGVDDLLVEEVPHHAQHPDVVVVRDQLFVAEVDAVEGDGGDLIVADRPPVPFAADEELVDAHLVDPWRETGVPHPPDPAALQVVDLHAHQLGEKEQAVGHGTAPPAVGRGEESRSGSRGRPDESRHSAESFPYSTENRSGDQGSDTRDGGRVLRAISRSAASPSRESDSRRASGAGAAPARRSRPPRRPTSAGCCTARA
jgi:hypothetical protein